MQIKMSIRDHLTPVRMAITKNIYKKQMLVRMWIKGNPLCTDGGNIRWSRHYGKQYEYSSKN